MPGKQNDKTSNVYRKTIGGMVGGLFEACCLHPLDTVKTRIQLAGMPSIAKASKVAQLNPTPSLGIVGTARSIIAADGVTGLYKGLSPFTVHLVTKYCLRFFTNYKIRELLSGGTGKTTNAQNFLAGLIAGTTEALIIVTPFEVVKTRLQAQKGAVGSKSLKYRGPVHAVYRILSREGPQGLWKGCAPTVFRQATNQASMFASYTFLRKNLWGNQENIATWQAFVTGVIAAMVGPCFNCPADVIKTRLMNQTHSMVEPHLRYKGFYDAFVRISKEEGIPALYKGIVPRLARLAPGQGITWIMVEQVNRLCDSNGWLL